MVFLYKITSETLNLTKDLCDEMRLEQKAPSKWLNTDTFYFYAPFECIFSRIEIKRSLLSSDRSYAANSLGID